MSDATNSTTVDMANRPWTPAELAAWEGVDASTVRNMIRAKLIRAHKFGTQWRIPADEVERIRREGCPLPAASQSSPAQPVACSTPSVLISANGPFSSR